MDEYRYEVWDAEGNKRDWYCEDVLTGKAPIDRVYEDDLVLAFHHPRPEWPVHLVVIPKAHTPSLLGPEALNPELLLAMVGAVQRVAKFALEGEVVTLVANAGARGVTPHMHWHVKSGGPIRT